MFESSDRRASARVGPSADALEVHARLWPGHDVEVLNLSSGGALVQSGRRILPGRRTELQLGGPTRRSVMVTVLRCEVRGLAPLRYVAALRFDSALGANGPAVRDRGNAFPHGDGPEDAGEPATRAPGSDVDG